MTRRALALTAFAAAALVTACGGGGGSATPAKQSISRLIVAGDSLADVGTFGAKFTVQNAASPQAGYPIYPEIVGANFGLSGQCPFFASTNGTAFTTRAGCTNYAVGDSAIANPAAKGGTAAPFSVPMQLATALQVAGGAWTPTDLILVDGGGNDARDLITAYLGLAGGAAGLAAYQTFLAQVLPPATIAATLPQPNGPAIAAGLYMTALADSYYNTLKTTLLDKGATHVAVLDMPDVSLTPRFKAVLGQVATAQGDAAAATLQAAIRTWISAFNTELANKVAGDARVAIVPFYADFTDEVANPAAYALTNVTTPVCPAVGFPASCLDTTLNAAPPAGAAAGWFSTYAFADGFHPTPFGHRLLAASISRALARAGWL
ncbi:SGNH/GDSL hydrolase family protein [Ramlibacter sp. CrO1]|uniref:SGNH/GDSL hydrolase family protein n=2 Tax=Ramlibacter algicola TaxID=2795217 RepID=A0A934PZC0_9BURK|nr:SGNH/GDSL hydrolase family protein [Ramlibacter algicola]